MKGDTPDTTIHSSSGSPADASALVPLKLDPDDFKDDIAALDLTDEQAKEILQTLWNIMSMFVDLGWGVDTLDIMLPELHKNLAQDSSKLLDSKDDIHEAATEEGPLA